MAEISGAMDGSVRAPSSRPPSGRSLGRHGNQILALDRRGDLCEGRPDQPGLIGLVSGEGQVDLFRIAGAGARRPQVADAGAGLDVEDLLEPRGGRGEVAPDQTADQEQHRGGTGEHRHGDQPRRQPTMLAAGQQPDGQAEQGR
ncbi:hypothetical protein ASD47_19320 [Caulobacter sp. Root1472]|nr:hypothetical protein ASD47_19320 [Caulobacter sp. Root1472]